jgi:hypothetical protein
MTVSPFFEAHYLCLQSTVEGFSMSRRGRIPASYHRQQQPQLWPSCLEGSSANLCGFLSNTVLHD